MKKEFITLLAEDDTLYLKDLSDGTTKKTDLNHLPESDGCVFVTFQPGELVSRMHEDLLARNFILDFECLDKQIRQSINLKIPDGKWSIPNTLSTYLKEEERVWHPNEQEELVETMARCYNAMKNASSEEWERICKIESPVNSILYLAQKRGFYISQEGIENICRDLHKRTYTLKYNIQLNYGVMDDDVEGYMRESGIECNNPNETEIEFWSRTNPNLCSFLEVRKLEKNLHIMLLLAATNRDQKKCYPIYKGFGTSTGRITLRDPAIQNLSKQYRYLLEDKALPFGYRFVYVDFGQFEAGILAGLSESVSFKTLYESDKVYEELANQINGNRRSAKIDFYRFVYGGNSSSKAKLFFKKYGLIEQVEKLKSDAIKNGYVESLFANRRMISTEDENMNWLVNHYIQSTGSLIFKQALINVDNSIGFNAQLVLPMHDAALYIVSNQVDTESIIAEYRKAFNKWIPDVNPLVKEKNFFEAEEEK